MGEHKSHPTRTKRHHFLSEKVLQFRQTYVRPTGFFNEVLHSLCVATSRENKGGDHGCTPKQVWIRDFFVFVDGLKWIQWF